MKTEALVSNDQHLDALEVYSLYKKNADYFQRREYETTQEFNQRLSSSIALIAPLTKDHSYAIQLFGAWPRYDADKELYTIHISNFCQSAADYGERKHWITCKVAEIENDRSMYSGSNAFGQSRTVHKTRGVDLGIAVPIDSRFLASRVLIRAEHIGNKPGHDLKIEFGIPISKARSLQDNSIGTLLIGVFTSARPIEGRTVYSKPKLNDPFGPEDKYITQLAAPFSPSSIIVFVIETGEILHEVNL